MKKILALFLALLMMAAAGLAAADSLEFVPGTPGACTFDNFRLYFDSIATGAGFAFTWNDTPAEENSFTVYSAASGDGLLQIQVYTQDQNVSHVVALGEVNLDSSDSDSAYTFGQWFGVAISGSAISMSLGAGDFSVTSDPDLSAKLEADVTPLTDLLYNDFDEEHLAAGKAGTATVLGYPCGLEVSGSGNDSNVYLYMKIILSTPDGQMSVK